MIQYTKTYYLYGILNNLELPVLNFKINFHINILIYTLLLKEIQLGVIDSRPPDFGRKFEETTL